MISLVKNKCFLKLQEGVLPYLKPRGPNWSFRTNQTWCVSIKQEQSQGKSSMFKGNQQRGGQMVFSGMLSQPLRI